MNVEIPDLSLVLIVGASGAGKTTFAARHFPGTQTLSSDAFRGMVCDDPSSFAATDDAFGAMADLAGRRLSHRRLTAVDATNLESGHRAAWLALAKSRHVPPVAIVLDVPVAVLEERRVTRPERSGITARALRSQADAVRRAKANLKREGWRTVHVLDVEAAASAQVTRVPLWTDRRDATGPFDVVGDVHGCADELEDLLAKLGYRISWTEGPRKARVEHPDGRRLAFVGDYVDRGPRNLDALRIVMAAVESGGLATLGNHDDRFNRWLKGKPVAVSHGLRKTVDEIESDPGFRRDAGAFLDSLVGHLWVDGGALCLTHAAVRTEMIGRASAEAREYCVFGADLGKDGDGRTVRSDWASGYRGDVTVAYGHAVVAEPQWVNRTVDLDTGCVFGGRLTAMRWPEREFVSVPAREEWHPYGRPLPAASAVPAQRLADASLDVSELLSTRRIATDRAGVVRLDEGQVAGAVDLLARHGADPRWIPYVPPTMSPVATSRKDGILEHPDEAFSYFRSFDGDVVCQEKHMGSRAVVAVCATGSASARRFGDRDRTGAVVTRTGRPFFDPEAEASLVARLRDEFDERGIWDELRSDWVLLDCEAMPWSLKAMGLVRGQYAPIGGMAASALAMAGEALTRAGARGVAGAEAEAAKVAVRADLAARYATAWRTYVEPVGDSGVRIAPFHVLACEDRTPILTEDHVDFHLAIADRMAAGSSVVVATRRLVVDPRDGESRRAGVAFFDDVVSKGGEGIVVKPRRPVGETDGAQPALKVRGKEYLRIVYGPEYDLPGNVERLRERAIASKRNLALRELAVGLTGLRRFVEGAPLRDVLACSLGVLALEQERVDGRL